MLQAENDLWETEDLYLIKVDGTFQIEMTAFDKRIFSLFKKENYKKILDLGCGIGKISLFLARENFSVYATDIAAEPLEKLKEKIAKESIENIQVYHEGFTDLGFSDSYFDAVLCKSTLHHATLAEIKAGIGEVFRVLRPGGLFVLDMISKEDISYGKGELIEQDTFIGSREGEAGIPHHYTDVGELEKLLADFVTVSISKKQYTIHVHKSSRFESKMYDIMAFK